ncbi:MAG: cytidine deaminase [Frankiales bacterium]|nr:cytidine deaminase [Frankiales bacterium]
MTDEELVEAARRQARERFRPGWHTVAAAMRTDSGQVFTAIHLDATVGRIAVCAEPIALGMAVVAGAGCVQTVVAVRHPRPHDTDRSIPIVSPCGMCRELLLDYAPEVRVLLATPDGGWESVRMSELLPHKYVRRGSEPPLGA